MRLLLVEDEAKMASLLCSGLSDEGFVVDVAVNGREGVWAATEHAYDVLIIDVLLPDVDGFDVCRQIRSTDTSTPVLMLTARSAVRDRVAGLDAGADDYLVKPFAFDELLARLRALLRRGPVSRSTVLSVGDLHLDPVGRRVWRGEQEVVLTAQEFSLLQTLARRPGQVLSRQQLTHLAWASPGRSTPTSSTSVCGACATASTGRLVGTVCRLSGVSVTGCLRTTCDRLAGTGADNARLRGGAGDRARGGRHDHVRLLAAGFGTDLDRELRQRAQDLTPVVAQRGAQLADAAGSGFIERGESFAEVVTPTGRVLQATATLHGSALLSRAEASRATTAPSSSIGVTRRAWTSRQGCSRHRSRWPATARSSLSATPVRTERRHFVEYARSS